MNIANLLPLPLPHVKTRTRRRNEVAEARKALAKYQAVMDPRAFDVDAPDPRRVMALLWAQARVERALALETRGRLGDLNATPRTVALDHLGLARNLPNLP